ncbi:MAG: outer membrane beta-barrel protein [bacterium]|nr:outer membrane beta-barrel protein [bacterium]
MFSNQRIRSLVLLFAAALLALPTLTDPALAEETGWKLRLGGTWVDPDVNVDTITDAGARARARSVDDINLGLGLEYRFSRRLGLDFAVSFVEPAVGLTLEPAGGGLIATTDKLSFTPITAGLNVHLTPGRRADLYIGPIVGYALYGDLSFDAGPEGQANFTSDDDFALGAQLGVDVAIGDGPWSIDAALRYLDTDLEATDEDGEITDIDFSPIMFSFGIGYRF